jgi:uracil-DNA glycosylase family 4
MLVGEAPGKVSIDIGRYWTGAGGQLLRSVAQDSGAHLEELFYLTDAVKCWPNNGSRNRKPSSEELRFCVPLLREEILRLRPHVIVTLGKTAAQQVLNRPVRMSEEHGKTYTIDGVDVVVFRHPSQINLHMPRNEYIKQFGSLIKGLIDLDVTSMEETRNPDNDTSSIRLVRSNGKKGGHDVIVFEIPAQGNSITQNDIKAGQIRITKDFKDLFPDRDAVLQTTVLGALYETPFRYRVGRSHVWRIGKRAMGDLRLRVGNKVRVTKRSHSEYEIERAK